MTTMAKNLSDIHERPSSSTPSATIGETEVERAFGEWELLLGRYRAERREAELSELMNRLGELRDRILVMPSNSARDIAMQGIVANYFIESDEMQSIFLRLAELTGVEVRVSRSY